MKILLTGGGSGGPVSPVLAVAAEIRKLKPRTQFLFVGTKRGPERAMVELEKIDFVAIPAARWRRFLTIKNLFAPFVFAAGLARAIMVVRKFRPDLIFTAGAFVGVPVAWAGRLFGAKILIHQQDARIGLANKLVSPFADQITTAFEYTAKMFYSGTGLFGLKLKPSAEWVGNPVRADLTADYPDVKKYFHLHDELPILLVLGGATGSKQINTLIEQDLPQLAKSFQIIHQTGRGKNQIPAAEPNYHPFELIPFPQYGAILKLADIVVARAGLSTIAELSALGKAAVIIPMSGTHQEDNARILGHTGAALVLIGGYATAENLLKAVNNLKFSPENVKILTANIRRLLPADAAEKLAKLCLKLIDPPAKLR